MADIFNINNIVYCASATSVNDVLRTNTHSIDTIIKDCVVEECYNCGPIQLSIMKVECVDACVASCTVYWTNVPPSRCNGCDLMVGDPLYTDISCTPAADGMYSAKPCESAGEYCENCYQVDAGIIIAVTACNEGTCTAINTNITTHEVCGSIGCFLEGTKIRGPKGEISIEKINKGDVIYSYDTETNEVVENVVNNLLIHKDCKDKAVLLTLSNNEEINVTLSHRFYSVSDNKWKELEKFELGDSLYYYNEGSLEVATIKQIDSVESFDVEYNLELETEPRNYFANNTLVHNAKTSYVPGACSDTTCTVRYTDGTPGSLVPGDHLYSDVNCLCSPPTTEGFYRAYVTTCNPDTSSQCVQVTGECVIRAVQPCADSD